MCEQVYPGLKCAADLERGIRDPLSLRTHSPFQILSHIRIPEAYSVMHEGMPEYNSEW